MNLLLYFISKLQLSCRQFEHLAIKLFVFIYLVLKLFVTQICLRNGKDISTDESVTEHDQIWFQRLLFIFTDINRKGKNQIENVW